MIKTKKGIEKNHSFFDLPAFTRGFGIVFVMLTNEYKKKV